MQVSPPFVARARAFCRAIGAGVLASALELITVFEMRLRAFTDGGPLGIFVMAAIVGALVIPVAVGMSLLRTMTGRTSARLH
jgi:hypothetical protein